MDWYGEPETPPVQVREVGSIEQKGWRSTWVGLMVLNGTTYLETAAHIFPDAPVLDQVPPERFFTRAYVVDISSQSQELPAPDCEIEGFEPDCDSLVLSLGWETALRRRMCYNDSPYFSPELQEWILQYRPVILGADTLSFDHPADTSMPFVRALFAQGGMILAPLVGLAQLPRPTVHLCVAPLRLPGASAAPCRVFAW